MMKRKLIEKMVIAATFAVFAAGFIPVTASAETADRFAVARLKTVEENYRAHLRAEALHAKKSAAIGESGPASLWLSRVAAEDVNMVTNRRESKKQSALSLNGKSYFCPNNAYAANMSNNPSIRFAKDPLTDKRIDKSDAVIYADASGRVYYFESEDTYKGFISLANAEKGFVRN
jgi:YHS domain-containing protein